VSGTPTNGCGGMPQLAFDDRAMFQSDLPVGAAVL
jgi:hypothetical protein